MDYDLSPNQWLKERQRRKVLEGMTSSDPQLPDLGTTSTPLIGPDIAENMADSSEYNRPRSSSGTTALKSLLSSKSKSRNKSVEREDKKDKDKDKDKKKGFFEQFRPRSKSDVSGLKRPAKKSSLPTDRSMDETSLTNQTIIKSFGGSQEAITPMGQILEGQMLNVPEEERSRHKSGPSGYREGGFMSKFRGRSNSETKTKSPKRTLQAERSLSPPSSPRADRSNLSPLKFQSGEPRSAPPATHRPTPFSDGKHEIIYKQNVIQRLCAPGATDSMEYDESGENEQQIYAKFMRAHKCYDVIPTSAKLVIFDTQLNVKKAFFALIANGVRAAPLWDTARQDYVGMLTITDFIYILRRTYTAPDARMEELEDHKIQNWREMSTDYERPFVYISPDASLFEAVRALIQHHVHRLPVVDEETGNAIYILTHKRILRFLHIYIKEIPQPSFMKSSIRELGIGTYNNVITTTPDDPIITVLASFMDYRISALPVVDSSGKIINIYSKFDVINLAASKTYNNLEITVAKALEIRRGGHPTETEGAGASAAPAETLAPTETVATCHQSDTLASVMEKIVKAEVHRLVIVDEEDHVNGIVSLSDLLQYIVLRPMAEAAASAASVEVQDPQELSLPEQVPQEQASLEESDSVMAENPSESS